MEPGPLDSPAGSPLATSSSQVHGAIGRGSGKGMETGGMKAVKQQEREKPAGHCSIPPPPPLHQPCLVPAARYLLTCAPRSSPFSLCLHVVECERAQKRVLVCVSVRERERGGRCYTIERDGSS